MSHPKTISKNSRLVASVYMRSIIALLMLVFLCACAGKHGAIEKEQAPPFMEWSQVKELIESGSVVTIYELNSEHLTLETSSEKRIDFIPPSIDEINKALFLAPNRENITWYYR